MLRQDLHRVILELRRVTVLNSTTEKTQQSINQGPNAQHLALSTRDLNDRVDALEKLIRNIQPRKSSHLDQSPISSDEKVTNTRNFRVLTTPRIPCRSWCPCACHAKQKLKVRVPGIIESMLGKIFVGYSGLPVLSEPCNFRVCRDRQNAAATVEYWFPWWFLSMNLKLHLTYLPWTGPQVRLSTTRRIPDDSQSISFAMQGDIDGLKYLFSQGLANPRDVSNSRGFTLLRVSLPSAIVNTL